MEDDQRGNCERADLVRRAIDRLSVRELLRLKAYAQIVIRVLSGRAPDLGWEDLLQEAIYRTLCGTRHWPIDIDLSWHIHETMRSIASNWRKQRPRLLSIETESLPVHESAVRGIPEPTSPARSAEQVLSAHEEVDRLRRHFSGDLLSIAVLNSWVAGMTGPEIQSALGITELEYRATAKKIRRHFLAENRGHR